MQLNTVGFELCRAIKIDSTLLRIERLLLRGISSVRRMYKPCWIRRREGGTAGTGDSIEAESNAIAAAATSACGFSTRRRAASLEQSSFAFRSVAPTAERPCSDRSHVSAVAHAGAGEGEGADRPQPESWAVAGGGCGLWAVMKQAEACLAWANGPCSSVQKKTLMFCLKKFNVLVLFFKLF